VEQEMLTLPSSPQVLMGFILFFFFLLSLFSVLLRFTASAYTFGIFKHFLIISYKSTIQWSKEKEQKAQHIKLKVE